MFYADFSDYYVPNIPDQILRRIAYLHRQAKKQMQSEEVTTTLPPAENMDLTVSVTTQPPQEPVSETQEPVTEVVQEPQDTVVQESKVQDQVVGQTMAENVDDDGDDDHKVQVKRRRRKKDEQTD